MNKEVKKKVRVAFNQSRLTVYRDEGKQDAFLRAATGVWPMVQMTIRRNEARDGTVRPDDWPKLKPGQRFDSDETNASKLLVSNLTGSWLSIFGRFPSGKCNSVFFNVMNDLLSALEQEQLGEAALKSMLPRK